MNRDDILKMGAGPKLNRRIFLDVLKMHEFEPNSTNNAICDICGRNGTAYGHPEPQDYSGDISAAFRVVEKMRADFTFAINDTHFQWCAMFVPFSGKPPFYSIVDNFDLPDERWTAWESTPSLAICRAALLAVME
jgi:hypothetical protein